jgi:cytochrome oxidase complex assembly protein 1
VTEGPPKPKSAARFVTVGCGIVIAIAVVIAALVGFAFYKISKGVDEVAGVASSWLAGQPQAVEEFGDVQKIERVPMSFNVQIRNDEGDAAFEFQITGSKASGRAWVRMVRRQGEWRPTGSRLTVGGRDVTIGSAPDMPKGQ